MFRTVCIEASRLCRFLLQEDATEHIDAVLQRVKPEYLVRPLLG